MSTRRGAEAAVIALDVGGTEIKGLVLNSETEVRCALRWGTPRRHGPDAVVKATLDALEELLTMAEDSEAVGLVVPGLVDEVAGVALYSENIEWRDVPFRTLLEERSGLPVGFGHDVRSGGLAERVLGAARGVDDVLFMPIGTGISGAIYVGGHLVHNMYAGEIGHISVGAAEPCACGAVGCLEAVASGAAIARRYGRETGNRVEGSREVLDRLAAGDPVASALWDDAVQALARALATYISILAPERIVIGGGVSHAGERLLEPLRERLGELLVWQREPVIVAAALADEAGCLGAGLLARRALADRTASVIPIQER
jgi:glucokinase